MSEAAVDDLNVLVMAGGSGTRFWPLSTEAYPKQFLTLFGEQSLLQASVGRVRELVRPEQILVATNARFVPLVAEQLPFLPPENIIGEPIRRDTGAAVALGALLLARSRSNGVMAVLTADHRIAPIEEFHRVLLSAARAAREETRALYTFGVVPTYPSTGYGYLHRAERIGDQEPSHFRLASFQEKPPREVAEGYVASGEHYWNSGMFVWSLRAILSELERQLPNHVRALSPAVEAWGTDSFASALARGFEGVESISIDFGVMEGARDVRCVEATFEWSDVGGWVALESYLERTNEGNSVRGRAHAVNASGNIVFNSNPDEDIALVGVNGLIVVRAGERTLVCRREDAEAIKQLVAELPEELR